jgi:antitoxin MazE
MEATLSKWGNSMGIRIPKVFLNDLQLEEGSTVIIEQEGNKIVITPKGPSLENMLSRINQGNIHEEIDTGAPRGKEAW